MLQRIVKVSRSGTDWTSTVMYSKTAYYSDGINIAECGTSAAIIITAVESITLSYQLSTNNVNYYSPVNNSNEAQGVLYNGSFLTTAGKWIVFNPGAAEWIRFQVDGGAANSTVTATFIHQEEIV